MAYFTPAAIILVFLLTLPLFLRTDYVSLFTKIIIFALLAMSLDLVFGYSGLWCFGQAGLFGVAAYTVAILVVKVGITSFWIVAPCAVGVAVITAALFGVLGLRSKEIYFMLITFAFGQLIYVAVYTTSKYTGGSNGLTGISYPDLGFAVHFNERSYYYFTLVAVVIAAILLYKIIKSPFGYSLMGIRDNEIRAKSLGYNTWARRFIAFILSGFFAGVAGVLYVYYRNNIAPSDVGLDYSGLVIMMVIIGGVGTLWGGVVGSAAILFLQYFVSLYTTQRWPLILGCLFIAAVFLAKDGIYPRFTKWWKRVCRYETNGGNGGGQDMRGKPGGDTYQRVATLFRGASRNDAGNGERDEATSEVTSSDG
ncbi:MAG: branched-chain amino acid ABC transporter permease [Actinomycetia bacterium]|nr:branched-chain amino acid ABC transporter permease [Actinomycetes bacterium]